MLSAARSRAASDRCRCKRHERAHGTSAARRAQRLELLEPCEPPEPLEVPCEDELQPLLFGEVAEPLGKSEERVHKTEVERATLRLLSAAMRTSGESLQTIASTTMHASATAAAATAELSVLAATATASAAVASTSSLSHSTV